MRSLVVALLGALCLIHSATSLAWWNPDWHYRKAVKFNTTTAGADVKQNLSEVEVLVRLHTGNMAFVDLKQDGSDLRFVSSDDKLPFKHHIEFFDPVNELAVVWVHVPKISGGSAAESMFMYFGNEKAAPAEDPKGTYDPAHVAVFHFAEKDASVTDATANAIAAVATGIERVPSGAIGHAARFNGSARIAIAPTPALQVAAGGATTFSAWVKGNRGALIERDGGKGLVVTLQDGKLSARLGAGQLAQVAEVLAADKWHHVGVVVSDRITIYLDGREAATAPAAAGAQGGEVIIGNGFVGELDEVQLANVARSPDWFKLAAVSQGPEAKLLTYGEGEEAGSSGSSYFTILLGAVTLDGWVVIGILMVMMVISFFVMISKSIFVVRADAANQDFLEQFRDSTDPLVLSGGETNKTALARSCIYQLYDTGVRELKHRFATGKSEAALSAQSIAAIRASIDATMVKENHRLNSQMVLLTIAISGGPFLGLLGTVVGVMITFAAIAAAGDVNVNSIAPGIAAALVATVAGLGVAIPALFGYNYLASRIKNVTTDMQVFADEFETKLAERYAP